MRGEQAATLGLKMTVQAAILSWQRMATSCGASSFEHSTYQSKLNKIIFQRRTNKNNTKNDDAPLRAKNKK